MKHTTAVSFLLSMASAVSAAALPAQNDDACNVFSKDFSPLKCGGFEGAGAKNAGDPSCDVFSSSFNPLKCGGNNDAFKNFPEAPPGGSVSTSCGSGNKDCTTVSCDANGKCTTTTHEDLSKRQNDNDSDDATNPFSLDFDPSTFIPKGIPGVTAPLPEGSEGSSTSISCSNGNCVTVTCDKNKKCTEKKTTQAGSKCNICKREDNGSTDPFSPDFDPFSFIPEGIPGVTAPLPAGSEGTSTSISCSNGHCLTVKCDKNGKCTQTATNQKL